MNSTRDGCQGSLACTASLSALMPGYRPRGFSRTTLAGARCESSGPDGEASLPAGFGREDAGPGTPNEGTLKRGRLSLSRSDELGASLGEGGQHRRPAPSGRLRRGERWRTSPSGRCRKRCFGIGSPHLGQGLWRGNDSVEHTTVDWHPSYTINGHSTRTLIVKQSPRAFLLAQPLDGATPLSTTLQAAER